MLEFLRESLLCNSEESPKHPTRRTRDRLSLCCAGGERERRRPAEIIASQGDVNPSTPAATSQVPWDYRQFQRKARTSSPLHCKGSPVRCRGPSPLRSPNSSFRTSASSFHSSLGNSVAYSGAALSKTGDNMTAGGLYVPMQRGLGPRSGGQKKRGDGGYRGHTPVGPQHTSPSRGMRGQKAPPQQGGMMRFSVPAASYKAVAEDDPVDRAVEQALKQLPNGSARALLVRRRGHCEYEVDGRVVRALFRGKDLVACTEEEGTCMYFGSFLQRAAEEALSRVFQGTPVGSFDSSHARVPPNIGGHPWALTPATAAPSSNGSFLLHTTADSSIVLNRSDGGGGSFTSTGGSFYGVHTMPSAGSWYMRAAQPETSAIERSVSQGPSLPPPVRHAPVNGGLTPPAGVGMSGFVLPRVPTQGKVGLPPPPTLVYAPQYVAVNA